MTTAPPDPLVHDVVIATKDRPENLETCLASVAVQERLPSHVLVIDASTDEASEAVCRAADPVLRITHQRAQPGLPTQRNIGIDLSDADVLHFLDDDVILEPGYLAAVAAVYDAHPTDPDRPNDRDVLGVGGLPTNLPAPPKGLAARLSGSSARPGRVLPSGRGVPVLRATSELEVDWLSGCCMSFRRSALKIEEFDDGLQGYALGEDLDLSYRVRQHGRLIVTPAARLVHLESPTNRWGRRRWGRVDVINRRGRVAKGTGDQTVRAFWLDALAQLSLWTLRGLRPGATDARDLALGMAEGLVAVARRRRA